MSEATTLPKITLLSIALLQGLLLLALYKTFDLNVWPSASPLFSYPLWTLALAVPVLLLLSLERGNERRLGVLCATFAVVLMLLAIYIGWQARPFGEFPVAGLSLSFGCSITLACFKALMYMQQRAAQLPLSYPVLFTYSWRNFLVLALSGLFVLAFFLVLLLWAELFKVISIEFFAELFRKDWFLFPVLAVMFGLGVIIFRGLTGILDSITAVLQGLIKLLLPLVVFVAVIFLLALPFTGLDVLWATGRGTVLMLGLTAVTLFFTNAVYQDGRGAQPYPVLVHRLIWLGLWALPVLCGISFYGLALRLQQYGWTVQRSWGMLTWLLLTLFSIGYVWGIARRRDDWTQVLARVNTRMGLVVLALMLLANSPLLDFRKISLHSQQARLAAGEIELEAFDFFHTHHSLARPGYLALQDFKANAAAGKPALLAMIENPRPRAAAQLLQKRQELWDTMVFRPEGFDVPQAVKAMIEETRFSASSRESVLVEVDLDVDGQAEYAVIYLMDAQIFHAEYFYKEDTAWQRRPFNPLRRGRQRSDLDTIKEAPITLQPSRFQDLVIGDVVLTP